jgi:hypothetical protein
MLSGFLNRLWCLDWCKERQIAPLSGEQYDTTALTVGGKRAPAEAPFDASSLRHPVACPPSVSSD